MNNVSRVTPRRPTFFSQLYVRLVLLILFVLLPALVLALLTTAEQNQVLINSARQQALTLTQLTAANQTQLVSGTERLLIALAQIPQVKNGETEACNALFSQLREEFDSYTNFYTVDMAGDTICTGLNTPAGNVADREWFRRAQTVTGFSVSNYAIGAASGLPVITLSYPIYDSAGQKQYYVGAALDLKWMNAFVDSTHLPPDTSLSAIDRSGVVLYRYPDGDDLIGQKHPNDQLIQTVVDQKTGITEGIGIDQIKRLYAFVPLDDNASAFVLVGLSQEVVFAQSRTILLQTLAVLGIVGTLTLLFAMMGVERLLVRPIRSLVNTTVRLAQGDLTTRVDTRIMGDIQELSELGLVFNTMAETLEQAHDTLETKVRERTQELALLAEASNILTSSLDYESTLSVMVRLVVPQLADWCTIDLLDDAGVVHRLAIAHVDPEKAAWARELNDLYPPNPNATSGIYHIIRSREALLIPHITEDILRQAAYDDRHFELLRKVGFVSSVAVPLIARGRVLGVLTLVSSKEEHHYGQDELKFVKELARRAATTIDNSYLYHELSQKQKQLQVTLSSIGDAVIATDIEGKIIFINPVAQHVTGWDEEDAKGQLLADVFHIVSETTGEPPENPFDKVVQEGKIVGLANHTLLIARDGSQIPIDDSGAPIFDEMQTLVGVILVFRNITERRLNEQRLSLLFELTAAFSQALTSREIAEVVVERGLKALGALVGTVCLLVEDGTMLEIINRHGLTPESFEAYRRTPLDLQGPLNDAVRTDSIVWIETSEEYIARYPHFAEAIRRNGSCSTISLPLKINDKKIGGFNLSFGMEKPRNPSEEAFFVALAQQCAQSLERARLYEVEQTARSSSDQNLQRVNRLQAATAALSEALTVSQVSAVILDHTMRATHASSGLLAQLRENSTTLDIIEARGYDSEALRAEGDISLEDIPPFVRESLSTRSQFWVEASAPLFEQLKPDVSSPQYVWAVLPLNSGERVLGILFLSISGEHDIPDESEKTFLLTLAQQCAQALERSQLYEQAKDVAALQERQRLARDLHDAVSQVLFSSTSIAETVPRMWERSPERAFEYMNQVVTLNRAAMAEMRSLLLELRPETILRTNLSQLIEQLFRAVKGRKSIETDFVVEGDEYFLPSDVHVAFYRIAQETINNSVKHSHATRITAHLTMTPTMTSLVIQDDGYGFDVTKPNPGMGLHTMHERALACEMQFELQSRVGEGTVMTLQWDRLT
jgi:PAS domain S-box-containing protein